MPDVYDDEKTSDDQLRDITGINKADEKAMEARAHEDLAAAEEGGSEPSDDVAAAKEKEKVDDAQGGWATNLGKSTGEKVKKARSRIKKTAAIVTTTIAVVSGIAGFLAAPHLVINHLRELILNKGQLQMQQIRGYRRMKLGQVKRAFTPDGRRANKLISEMQRYGYRPRFDGGRLLGLERVGGNAATFGTGTINEMEDFINKRYPYKTARWKTKQMNAVYRKLGVPRRSVIIMADSLDESVDTLINKRIAEGLLSDEDIRIRAEGIDAPEGESEAESTDRAARERLARDIIEDEGVFEDIRKKILEGEKIENLLPEERAALRIAGDMFDEDALRFLDEFAKVGIKGKFIGALKGVGASITTEIPNTVCSIKRKLSAALLAARIYRSRALIRYATIFVTASDQTRKGEVGAAMAGELMKRVAAPDENGQFIGSSPGFRNLLGKNFSKSENDASKSLFSVDGSHTGIAKGLDDALDGIPGTSPGWCNFTLHPATQVGAGILEGALTILTAGGYKLAGEGAEQSAKLGIKTALEHTIKNMLTKRGLASMAGNIGISLSFEMITTYIELQAQKSLALTFTGQESGAMLGHIIAGGAGAMSKQRALRSGLVPATKAQYAQAQSEYIAWEKEEIKKQSFYSRIFDYSNHNSVMFNLATSFALMPMTPQGLGLSLGSSLQKITGGLLSNPMSLFSSVGNVLGSSALAQSDDEIAFDTFQVRDDELAVDAAGNVLPILPRDIQNIDTDENIDYLISAGQIDSADLQPRSGSTFAKHIENCVDNVDSFTVLEEEDQTKPEYDCLAKQRETKKYKAHLAYLDMIDGIDAWLFPEDLTGNAPESDPISTPASPTDNNLNEPSFARNPNVRVDGSPSGPHRASNCSGTFTVGAASLKAVIEERWRPPVTSIGGYSCRRNTASPTTSIHGLGRALDVMIDGTTAEGLAKGNEIRNWVINNATQLGVQRVIWDRHTWAANRDGWRRYTGPDPHVDHLHIEINVEASAKGDLGR